MKMMGFLGWRLGRGVLGIRRSERFSKIVLKVE